MQTIISIFLLILGLQLTTLAVTVNCGDSPVVLATVNKDKITLDDLLDKIRKDSIPPEDSLNDPT
ncbi:MAG: hypothetical protein L0Y74_08330, partial [candidate division Zixibacteria bacterium]|nr:hypothetical protein [candidate division Zixibacteria bacterium]